MRFREAPSAGRCWEGERTYGRGGKRERGEVRVSRVGEGIGALRGVCESAVQGVAWPASAGGPLAGLRLTAPFSLSVSACVAVGGAAAASDVPQDGLLLHGPFARKPKRIRTAFSPSQLLRLERAFEKNHYVVGAERKQLAGSLSLSETQVMLRAAPGGQVEGGPERPASPPAFPSFSRYPCGAPVTPVFPPTVRSLEEATGLLLSTKDPPGGWDQTLSRPHSHSP
ncbi:hypothetical protein J1605_011332 [Eschrichtius robustus]|uniref:Homeobox domain-containing protein n=1 Tax=Eschrichtius robustus TaxID=9764 RepID=A0AB34GQ34_ESCRO|nr:hypothetical protein J1605_011332 [Eschrichtius robustus]